MGRGQGRVTPSPETCDPGLPWKAPPWKPNQKLTVLPQTWGDVPPLLLAPSKADAGLEPDQSSSPTAAPWPTPLPARPVISWPGS